MSRAPSAQVVTGNALLEGDVIYQGATGWVRALSAAQVFTEQAEAEAALAAAQARPAEIVGAYLAEVATTEDGPAPVHFREDFRRKGPSNRNHGKQAEAL